MIRAAMLSLALTFVAGAASAQTAASVHAGTLGVEAARIEEEADFSLYPVAQIGLSYRF